MKKLLLGFLMLMMLTPGLACGPIMGAGKAHAAQPAMEEMADCPGMGMNNNKKSQGKDDPTFFKDCLHIDLQGADYHADLKKPDISGKSFFIASAFIVPDTVSFSIVANIIRGPPPDWPDISQTQPSILLTTQRFRE